MESWANVGRDPLRESITIRFTTHSTEQPTDSKPSSTDGSIVKLIIRRPKCSISSLM